jgi:hypothetical protein
MSEHSPAKKVGRAAAYPLIRLLEPRFADLVRRLTDTRQAVHDEAAVTRVAMTENVDTIVGGYAASHVESLSHIGTEMRQVDEAIQALSQRIDELGSESAIRHLLERLGPEARVDDLDAVLAALLNYAESHRGFAAQRGLWLNPPISLQYSAGAVDVGGITERIVEVPFAYRALGQVPAGSRVLDFGAVESPIALSLASLGYTVTALDLRPYPFEHPNLTSVAKPLEEWDVAEASFDAVLCISTIEHVGLGWYGEEPGEARGGDRAAMDRLATLLVPDGRLVLTVPYGTTGVTDVQRTYDGASLDALLDGWRVLERQVVAQTGSLAWSPVDDAAADAVAMVVAMPPAR